MRHLFAPFDTLSDTFKKGPAPAAHRDFGHRSVPRIRYRRFAKPPEADPRTSRYPTAVGSPERARLERGGDGRWIVKKRPTGAYTRLALAGIGTPSTTVSSRTPCSISGPEPIRPGHHGRDQILDSFAQAAPLRMRPQARTALARGTGVKPPLWLARLPIDSASTGYEHAGWIDGRRLVRLAGGNRLEE